MFRYLLLNIILIALLTLEQFRFLNGILFEVLNTCKQVFDQKMRFPYKVIWYISLQPKLSEPIKTH